MKELFGVPVGTLAAILAALLGVALAVVVAIGLRERVFLRLAARNIGRRRARSALIVAGLMLGTTIIAAAMATGDTMSHTIRTAAIASLGQTDEVISARGAEAATIEGSVQATGRRFFAEGTAGRVARALAGTGLADGVAPAIIEPVAAQDARSRQNEPRVTLFASDPARLRGFGTIRGPAGQPLSLADLRPGEIYLNADAAGELDARRGDTIRLLAGRRSQAVRVREIVDYEGGGTDGPGLLVGLAAAQRLLGEPGRIGHVLVSNRGDALSGAPLSDQVVERLRPVLGPLGLEADTSKQDAIEAADEGGSAFMSFFTTFGSFSIAAGVLLIFLIFVMLAAERRGELGIARAIGTRRGHLVEAFLFEGVAYDLVAAAVGAAAGLAVAYAMVLVLAQAFSSAGDVDVTYAISWQSVVVSYAIGVLLTFAVVTVSAWRVSRMNVVTAIRDLPEPPPHRARRRSVLRGAIGVAAAILLIVSGASQRNAITLGLGVSLLILSLVPLARAAGLPDRATRTTAGLLLVAYFLLPVDRWLLGDLKMDFSIFILSGLVLVVGATWTIMYNADLLLRALSATLGHVRAVAPVLRMAAAYPLRSLFRTGVTLAMFTLVVFTLVVGATTSGAFTNAFDDEASFGGGFDVRATTAPTSPILDMRAALATAPGVDAADATVVASQSVLPVDARQVGTGRGPEGYIVRGLDDAFLPHTTYGMATTARGYDSPRAVWQAIARRPGLAVVDSLVVPHRADFGFGPLQEFQVTGLYAEDEHFDPFAVAMRDPQTGRRLVVTVIGVLADTAPSEMTGVSTSQRTAAAAFGDRVAPTVQLFALRPGVDAPAFARSLERAFLANGMEADAIADTLHDVVAANLTFNRIIQGFMGLGLIVGVAALGVITARSVVERRQQIGVLRAIGFRRRMIQASFLMEASFIALTAIAVGTALGLVVSSNVIRDAARQPSWSNIGFDVPWLNLGVIFLAVYAVALATTFAPALRASRVFPAEALRYQ